MTTIAEQIVSNLRKGRDVEVARSIMDNEQARRFCVNHPGVSCFFDQHGGKVIFTRGSVSWVYESKRHFVVYDAQDSRNLPTPTQPKDTPNV